MAQQPTPQDLLAALRKSAVIIQKQEQELAAYHEPLAIIGMGCRYPGAADTPARFWQNLLAGLDGVGPLPDQRAKDLARKGRAEGYTAGVICVLRLGAFLRQPGRQYDQPARDQRQHHLARGAGEGGEEEGKGRKEQDARAALGAAGPGHGGGRGAVLRALRAGAVFAAETLGHYAPPEAAT